MDSSQFIDLGYLISASLFVLGIKGLTKPRTAVRGNKLAATGLVLAVLLTLLNKNIISYKLIVLGGIIGGSIGVMLAKRVQMTAMPQLVAALNGFGGGSSVAIAAAEYFAGLGSTQTAVTMAAMGITTMVGAITLTGSFVAFAKLQELIDGQPMGFPGMKAVNVVLVLFAVLFIYLLVQHPEAKSLFWLLLFATALLGVLVVLPIGGADMPVVIALLNSYSGVAAAAAGFLMDNNALIITGALVGASGLILTQIMCRAMNRSLTNVLFGVMAEGGENIDADEVYAGKVKSSSADEVAMILETAQRVVIVPGFGLAMAQAQHAVRDLADTLEATGVEVEYAIHPVAGRMPGHMNVLLAEAEVSYDKLKDMDAINPTFEQTDVAIVIGANDVTNPMAREDKGSPIYGMPILNVDKAKTVVVVKRSLSPGFAGLPNPLFAMDNTLMLFGDGKQAIIDINGALKEG